MKLTNLKIQLNGTGYLEHRITYVNKNGTQCRETLCSGEEFAQHVSDCLEAVPELRMAVDTLRETHSMFAVALQIDSTKPSDILKAIANVKSQLARPDATQPQLSEIRYVLHGDIQPCSVLYSDDTTTLLRLDEGDMMCETDTIEWSDSVTYRCQELLKSESIRKDALFVKHAVPVLAQLVRDERILLNDNGDDALETSGTVDLKVDSDIGVGQPVVRVRKPNTSDAPFLRHSPVEGEDQPCEECGHVFYAQGMMCPMCTHTRSVAFSHDTQPKQEH